MQVQGVRGSMGKELVCCAVRSNSRSFTKTYQHWNNRPHLDERISQPKDTTRRKSHRETLIYWQWKVLAVLLVTRTSWSPVFQTTTASTFGLLRMAKIIRRILTIHFACCEAIERPFEVSVTTFTEACWLPVMTRESSSCGRPEFSRAASA